MAQNNKKILNLEGLEYYDQNIKNYINSKNIRKADLIDGVVPSDLLPSYVDDVVELYSLTGELPLDIEEGTYTYDNNTKCLYQYNLENWVNIGNPKKGKIYVNVEGDKAYTYRWSGSCLVRFNNECISKLLSVKNIGQFIKGMNTSDIFYSLFYVQTSSVDDKCIVFYRAGTNKDSDDYESYVKMINDDDSEFKKVISNNSLYEPYVNSPRDYGHRPVEMGDLFLIDLNLAVVNGNADKLSDTHLYLIGGKYYGWNGDRFILFNNQTFITKLEEAKNIGNIGLYATIANVFSFYVYAVSDNDKLIFYPYNNSSDTEVYNLYRNIIKNELPEFNNVFYAGKLYHPFLYDSNNFGHKLAEDLSKVFIDQNGAILGDTSNLVTDTSLYTAKGKYYRWNGYDLNEISKDVKFLNPFYEFRKGEIGLLYKTPFYLYGSSGLGLLFDSNTLEIDNLGQLKVISGILEHNLNGVFYRFDSGQAMSNVSNYQSVFGKKNKFVYDGDNLYRDGVLLNQEVIPLKRIHLCSTDNYYRSGDYRYDFSDEGCVQGYIWGRARMERDCYIYQEGSVGGYHWIKIENRKYDYLMFKDLLYVYDANDDVFYHWTYKYSIYWFCNVYFISHDNNIFRAVDHGEDEYFRRYYSGFYSVYNPSKFQYPRIYSKIYFLDGKYQYWDGNTWHEIFEGTSPLILITLLLNNIKSEDEAESGQLCKTTDGFLKIKQ